MVWRIISAIWAFYHMAHPAEWLAGIALAWWGWFRYDDGRPAAVLFAAAVLVVVLGQIARAMEYHLFIPGETPAAAPLPTKSSRIVAVGDLYGYLHPEMPLVIRRFHLGSAVGLRWLERDRPPRLFVAEPPSTELPIRHESGAQWAEWFPGSDAQTGTVYLGGSALPGLRLTFAGRRMVLGADDPSAIAEVARLITETF